MAKKATKSVKPVAKKPKATKSAYEIEILLNGVSAKGNGSDILDAISKIEIPEFIKTEVVIKVSGNGKNTETYLNTQKARRMLGGGMSTKLLAIQLGKLLG